MNHTKTPKILILGANGMLGRTVFNYFLSKYPEITWGTVRNKPTDKTFNYDVYEDNLVEKIIRQLDGVDYVINCIGILRSEIAVKEQIFINSYFPHLLEDLAEKNNFSLIHISTDAVFAPDVKKVNEDSYSLPTDIYGRSKLLGETESSRALTFRTSILGIDKINGKGFLNWLMKNSKSEINGYTNQKWNGCTTLQFAQFCSTLIEKNRFQSLRAISPVFHFAPIETTTKYEIAKTFIDEMNYESKLIESKGQEVTRELDTKYEDILLSYYQKVSIKSALHELVLFEKINT